MLDQIKIEFGINRHVFPPFCHFAAAAIINYVRVKNCPGAELKIQTLQGPHGLRGQSKSAVCTLALNLYCHSTLVPHVGPGPNVHITDDDPSLIKRFYLISLENNRSMQRPAGGESFKFPPS